MKKDSFSEIMKSSESLRRMVQEIKSVNKEAFFCSKVLCPFLCPTELHSIPTYFASAAVASHHIGILYIMDIGAT